MQTNTYTPEKTHPTNQEAEVALDDATCSSYFVVAEPRDGTLSLPEIAAWESCHSLVHSPSGVLDAPDAQWVGFFVNRDVAERVKFILETNA